MLSTSSTSLVRLGPVMNVAERHGSARAIRSAFNFPIAAPRLQTICDASREDYAGTALTRMA